MKVSSISRGLAAAVAMTCIAGPAYAVNSSLSFESVSGASGTDVAYTGSLKVTGTRLTLRLHTQGSGGYLTGVAFNAPEGSIIGISAAPSHFGKLGRADAWPFGVYSDGTGLGAPSRHGGTGTGGVPVGESATFVYALADHSYRASDFWSDTCTKAEGCAAFTARFRGSDAEPSEKAAALLTPVPEPETYALMLAGVGLVGFIARRRRAD